MKRLYTGIFLLCTTAPAAAALSLNDGHTGFYGIRGAYTLEEGSSAHNFWAGSTLYPVPSSTSTLGLNDITYSFHQGVTNNFEVGFYFPGRQGIGTGRNDLQYLGLSLKYKFDETPATKDAVAVTLYGGMLAAPAALGVGSGDSNYGLDIDYSNRVGGAVIHTSLGIKSDDTITVTGANSATFAVDSKLHWALGAEIPTVENQSFNLGIDVETSLMSGNSNTNLLPSYTWRASDGHLQYQLGLGYNLTPAADQPLYQYYMGMTYRFDSPKKQIARLEQRITMMEGLMNNLITSQGSQDAALELVDERYNNLYANDLPITDHRLTELEKKMEVLGKDLKGVTVKPATPPVVLAPPTAQMAPAAPAAPVVVPMMKSVPGKLHVEIINRSTDPKLHERIARQLEAKGYIVVSTHHTKDTLQRTHVYYKKGFSKQAVDLGHSLPKNQLVVRDAALSQDIELRLELGDDLK